MSEDSTILNTYLGQKGYTIFKKDLTSDQCSKIKKDLTIKPFTQGGVNCQKTFTVYRESDKKIYLPHYYGVENFGEPKEYKITEGINISLDFNGKLRDYQEPVVDKFIKHCKDSNYGGGLLELFCAWGKTSSSLYICSQLKKKTIVIVHKEFLMNQWIERIKQFIPDAKIGKIQGPIIDVEGKDIVLCMLKSLISNNYDQKIFDQFGFTIIDEVHHISSQTFSNALFKVVTKYMLGLSATMERKDGTTSVFKMFLGDIIHKSVKKNEHFVEVRALNYKVNDEEFNETILDYKGQPQNSSMISKLCEYNRRSEFIVKVLCDFISVDDVDIEIIRQHKNYMDNCVPKCEICTKNNNYLMINTCCNVVKYCLVCLENIENSMKSSGTKKRAKCPDCKKVLKYEQNYIENPYVKTFIQTQTIVMAQNLNILHYMYRKFVCKNLASVGYYIGGMSECELKKSETKQVIFSSYGLASEGLDIPTLNAEFLITPKTDVIQITGRILRAKHAFSNPIIYDFVDSHEIFKRQWLKRKDYYRKQNYKIVESNNTDYDSSNFEWKVINDPNKSKIKEISYEEDIKPIGKCLLKIQKK
uniref:Helicase ATP-binding domain-containing protein n=1 Tax=viral metagenome TaxID=1070528 RepID=A0A6C0KZ68_9ZZZZ